jgi:hypothetical protein
MIYSYPIPFKCYPALAEYTQQYMEKYSSHWIYQVNVPLPRTLRIDLDTELARYELSSSKLCVAFKRRGYFGERHVLNTSSSVHVDWNSKENTITHSSIIFPVSGCKDTYQYWVDGKYTLLDTEEQDPNGVVTKWKICNWKEPGIVVDEKAYIESVPTLVRTDIPHCVVSRTDGSYRTVLSIRLKNNETFEEIVQKITAKTV